MPPYRLHFFGPRTVLTSFRFTFAAGCWPSPTGYPADPSQRNLCPKPLLLVTCWWEHHHPVRHLTTDSSSAPTPHIWSPTKSFDATLISYTFLWSHFPYMQFLLISSCLGFYLNCYCAWPAALPVPDRCRLLQIHLDAESDQVTPQGNSMSTGFGAKQTWLRSQFNLI